MSKDTFDEYEPLSGCKAPQFVDFTALPLGNEDEADSYFDFDHENGVPVDFGEMSSAVVSAQEAQPLRRSTRNTPAKKTSTPKTEANAEAFQTPMATPGNKRRNTLTIETPTQMMHRPRTKSIGATPTSAQKRRLPSTTISASSRRRSRSCNNRPVNCIIQPAKPVEKQTGKHNHSMNSPSNTRRSERTGQKPMNGVAATGEKSYGSHGRSRSLTNATSKQRTASAGRNTSLNKSSKSDGSFNTSKMPPPSRPKLTMAVTPTFMKRRSVKTSAKNSEQIEMEKIKELRNELAKKKKMAKESYLKAQSSVGLQPLRSHQPTTKVEQFSFATDKRFKDVHPDNKECDYKDFTSTLRKNTDTATEVHRGTTVPQPFNLNGMKRKRVSEETGEYFESMAEKVNAFAKRTPDRFHSRPITTNEPRAVKRRRSLTCGPKLTIPVTPHLESRKRQRPREIASQTELDEQEIDEIKRYKFVAKPMNKKIFKITNLGVPKVLPKEPTVPLNMRLHTESRQKVQPEQPAANLVREFHAQPVPKGMLDGPTGLKPAQGIALTFPESPAFALKNRLRSHTRKETQEETFAPVARRMPKLDAPVFQPKVEHKVVEVKPFSFDLRDRETMKRKEQKIQEVYKEERKAREFHANPLPDLSPEPMLPKKVVKQTTKPMPFDIRTDVRGAQKADKWFHQIEEELKEQREKAGNFKAKPSSSLYREPFVPKRSTRPLTGEQLNDVTGFELNTVRRHEERSQWEAGRLKEEQVKAMMQEAARKRQQEEEDEKIRRWRQEAVHKPQPIRQYKPVRLQPSDVPLTIAQSPRFSKRLQKRSKNDSL